MDDEDIGLDNGFSRSDQNLQFVTILQKYKSILDTSMVPSKLEAKRIAMANFQSELNTVCGLNLTDRQIMKKIQNMGARIQLKLKHMNGNKRYNLKDFEVIYLQIKEDVTKDKGTKLRKKRWENQVDYNEDSINDKTSNDDTFGNNFSNDESVVQSTETAFVFDPFSFGGVKTEKIDEATTAPPTRNTIESVDANASYFIEKRRLLTKKLKYIEIKTKLAEKQTELAVKQKELVEKQSKLADKQLAMTLIQLKKYKKYMMQKENPPFPNSNETCGE